MVWNYFHLFQHAFCFDANLCPFNPKWYAHKNVKAVTAAVNGGCCILCDYWQFDIAENQGDQ